MPAPPLVYPGMTELSPESTTLDRYGSAELEWSRAHDALAAVPTPDVTHFLGTCRPDGTPHAAGVGALWLAGDLYFTSGPAARKARDLVLTGTATRVTDGQTLEQVAAGYRDGGWPARVDQDALTAPFSATRWRFQRS
ncbi:MAG TPA: pyridoxamine 5'-phosphate oxidase family protein [Micromonosporaceae bacterium]|nr:pyridoxamine 5'-phosphate oxidase family protein [Micromonosporaceae bacterium]